LSSQDGGSSDSESGVFLYASTGTDGRYRFSNVYIAANAGFTITARPSYAAAVSQNSAFTTEGQQVTLNFTLPLTIVKGSATYADGSLAVSPQIFLTDPNPSSYRTYYALAIDPSGNFVIVGPPAGDNVTVTLQDNDSGLSVSAPTTVAALGAATLLDVTLPATETVIARVQDASGNSVTQAWLELVSPGVNFQRSVGADASGNYTFVHVPLGTGYLQAVFYDPQRELASASFMLSTTGETLNVTVSQPAKGQVNGTVSSSTGTAVAGANVVVVSFGAAGPIATFSQSVTTDASGAYSVPGVPQGLIHVVASDPSGYPYGVADGTLTGATVTLNPTLGNGSRFYIDLNGTDGFSYPVADALQLYGGGTEDRRLSAIFGAAETLTVNGLSFFSVNAATLEANGSQVMVPEQLGALAVTRKVFVPPAGGFARYLEVLSNPTGVAQPAQVTLQGYLDSGGSTHVVVGPSATSNTYAVMDANGVCCTPAVGFVFGGPNASVTPTLFQFTNQTANVGYQWQVMVPANGSVALMHFVLQRDPSDPTVASTAAEGLAALTDPNALVGLTAAEKALIVNFVVPR
jgi:hypothetical protein